MAWAHKRGAHEIAEPIKPFTPPASPPSELPIRDQPMTFGGKFPGADAGSNIRVS